MVHDGAGTVTRVLMDYMLANATLGKPFTQTYSIGFVEVCAKVLPLLFLPCHYQSDVSSVFPVRPLSGSPGYLFGLPVIAGTLVTNSTFGNKQAISLNADSLGAMQIPGSTPTGRQSGKVQGGEQRGNGNRKRETCTFSLHGFFPRRMRGSIRPPAEKRRLPAKRAYRLCRAARLKEL